MFSLLKYIYDTNWNKRNNENTSHKKNVCSLPVEKLRDVDIGKDESRERFLDEKDLQKLRHDLPDIVLSNHRNLLGLVVSVRDDGNIEIDADMKQYVLELAKIKSECKHEAGDRIYLRCYIQNEELFTGEICQTLEPFAIEPTKKRKNQKCMVDSIQSDSVMLNNKCFISKKVLKEFGGNILNVGDFLHVDMVECNSNNLKWRCTYFALKKDSDLPKLSRGKKQLKHSITKADDPKRLVLPTPSGAWNCFQNRLCKYTNQVWSQETGEIVPAAARQIQRRFQAIRIPFYDIPYEIRFTYLTEYNNLSCSKNLINKYFDSLKEGLTFKNYVKYFQLLLWLEEIELFKSFRQYDMERTQFIVDAEFLAITIINLGERRPSLVIGDKVRAYPIVNKTKTTESSINRKCYEGIVFNVEIDKVYLKFNDYFHENYKGESYRLEFYFSRINFRRKHYAIHRAVEHFGKEFLFPQEINFRKRPQLDIRLDEKSNNMINGDHIIQWHNSNLNESQRKAVFNILRCETHMPYVIYGPPGTGKTVTMIEGILQLVSNLPQSHLLVATPSNSSANLLCSRLIESRGLHTGEMVRLVPYNLVEREQIPEHLLKYCATADLGADGTFQEEMYIAKGGLQMNVPLHELSRYRVIIGTYSTLGKCLEMGFNKNHFTHVLIDEAGQCSEPDIMIPLIQVAISHGQFILAGDPMQLQAIVTNKCPNGKGLSVSFLERIMNSAPYRKDLLVYSDSCGYNPLIMTKLCQNYRSLPSIMRIYNYLFYDLELIPTISETDSKEVEILKKLNKTVLFPSETRPPSHGAFFYSVRGENLREKDSPSWYNPREANVVFNTTLEFYRAGMKPEDIGIISPYIKQVRCIRALFLNAKLLPPKIGSVEEFQGQERNVILLSTVRTGRREYFNYDTRYGLGFVRSERRLNVAVSRARALLIVFGDFNLLKLDVYWCIYIQDCCDNDSFFGRKSQRDDKSLNTVDIPNKDDTVDEDDDEDEDNDVDDDENVDEGNNEDYDDDEDEDEEYSDAFSEVIATCY